MITFQRKPALRSRITRHFEATRLRNQMIVSAYQSLIPVISRHPGRPQSRTDDNETETTIQGIRSKAEGA